jgi:hypothetical protein
LDFGNNGFIYAGNTFTATNLLTEGVMSVVSILYNGASSKYKLNEYPEETGNAGTYNTNGIVLGSNKTGTGLFAMAEFGTFGISSPLTSQERVNIRKYLYNRWYVNTDTFYNVYKAHLVCTDGENIAENIITNTLGLDLGQWALNFDGNQDVWGFYVRDNYFDDTTIVKTSVSGTSYSLYNFASGYDTILLNAPNDMIDCVITIKKLKGY